MAIDEEYLDSLLRAITESETPSEAEKESAPSDELLPPENVVTLDENPAFEVGTFAEEAPVSEAVSFAEEYPMPEAVSFAEEASVSENASFEIGDLPTEDIALADEDMLSEGDISFGNDVLSGENMLPEDTAFGGDGASLETSSLEDEGWMDDLKNLIGSDGIPEDDSDLDASINDMNDMDISDLMAGIGSMDDELEEIHGLLKNAGDEESADIDMLTLLQSIESSVGNEEPAMPFESLLEDEAAGEEEKPSRKSKKKRAKKEKPEKKRRFFGKKKRAEQEEGEIPEELVVPFEVAEAVIEQEKNAAEADFEDAITEDGIGQEPEEGFAEEGMEQSGGASESEGEAPGEETQGEAAQGEEAQKPKEKKPGFLARLLTALTSEEDEPENISEENKEILNELEEEDKQSGKKKEKKGKKGGKKKKGKEAQQEGEGDEAAEDAEAGDKKKKPKKEKKPKEPKGSKEKGVKVLSRRNLIVLIAFCATIIGSVILLSSFLPEYADKKSARSAYYAGDYEAVYTLLYDRNLSSGDLLIFNRAKTIRKMERRIESYENNLAIGRELEALDSLLKGVECYQTLREADEYGVRQEVDALYQQICGILEGSYGITADEAIEINSYDSATYTRRLYAAVGGTVFAGSGGEVPQGEAALEEPEEPLPPQDILPEEEGIISE